MGLGVSQPQVLGLTITIVPKLLTGISLQVTPPTIWQIDTKTDGFQNAFPFKQDMLGIYVDFFSSQHLAVPVSYC